ncbi:conserved Plasmodium protein, unknown function [Plasmodium vinckei vinckei]|uniref:Uncharacterized protein n=1 Tax=Plasmodium vinckei vinckei TaxID=54757 RepID=A0A449BU15_PLAVN|nr:conserved Plasmodium protein, unknown function [Plasmodium vinckei vinckei]KEG03160.1 hypothetical protein YYE_02094 [Plasmodium vinckei vinckei]VEV56967.1 conserved Plasmodium protein, unknown function [Plasmodium vinckei vinckei]
MVYDSNQKKGDTPDPQIINNTNDPIYNSKKCTLLYNDINNDLTKTKQEKNILLIDNKEFCNKTHNGNYNYNIKHSNVVENNCNINRTELKTKNCDILDNSNILKADEGTDELDRDTNIDEHFVVSKNEKNCSTPISYYAREIKVNKHFSNIPFAEEYYQSSKIYENNYSCDSTNKTFLNIKNKFIQQNNAKQNDIIIHEDKSNEADSADNEWKTEKSYTNKRFIEIKKNNIIFSNELKNIYKGSKFSISNNRRSFNKLKGINRGKILKKVININKSKSLKKNKNNNSNNNNIKKKKKKKKNTIYRNTFNISNLLKEIIILSSPSQNDSDDDNVIIKNDINSLDKKIMNNANIIEQYGSLSEIRNEDELKDKVNKTQIPLVRYNSKDEDTTNFLVAHKKNYQRNRYIDILKGEHIENSPEPIREYSSQSIKYFEIKKESITCDDIVYEKCINDEIVNNVIYKKEKDEEIKKNMKYDSKYNPESICANLKNNANLLNEKPNKIETNLRIIKKAIPTTPSYELKKVTSFEKKKNIPLSTKNNQEKLSGKYTRNNDNQKFGLYKSGNINIKLRGAHVNTEKKNIAIISDALKMIDNNIIESDSYMGSMYNMKNKEKEEKDKRGKNERPFNKNTKISSEKNAKNGLNVCRKNIKNSTITNNQNNKVVKINYCPSINRQNITPTYIEREKDNSNQYSKLLKEEKKNTLFNKGTLVMNKLNQIGSELNKFNYIKNEDVKENERLNNKKELNKSNDSMCHSSSSYECPTYYPTVSNIKKNNNGIKRDNPIQIQKVESNKKKLSTGVSEIKNSITSHLKKNVCISMEDRLKNKNEDENMRRRIATKLKRIPYNEKLNESKYGTNKTERKKYTNNNIINNKFDIIKNKKKERYPLDVVISYKCKNIYIKINIDTNNEELVKCGYQKISKRNIHYKLTTTKIVDGIIKSTEKKVYKSSNMILLNAETNVYYNITIDAFSTVSPTISLYASAFFFLNKFNIENFKLKTPSSLSFAKDNQPMIPLLKNTTKIKYVAKGKEIDSPKSVTNCSIKSGLICNKKKETNCDEKKNNILEDNYDEKEMLSNDIFHSSVESDTFEENDIKLENISISNVSEKNSETIEQNTKENDTDSSFIQSEKCNLMNNDDYLNNSSYEKLLFDFKNINKRQIQNNLESFKYANNANDNAKIGNNANNFCPTKIAKASSNESIKHMSVLENMLYKEYNAERLGKKNDENLVKETIEEGKKNTNCINESAKEKIEALKKVLFNNSSIKNNQTEEIKNKNNNINNYYADNSLSKYMLEKGIDMSRLDNQTENDLKSSNEDMISENNIYKNCIENIEPTNYEQSIVKDDDSNCEDDSDMDMIYRKLQYCKENGFNNNKCYIKEATRMVGTKECTLKIIRIEGEKNIIPENKGATLADIVKTQYENANNNYNNEKIHTNEDNEMAKTNKYNNNYFLGNNFTKIVHPQVHPQQDWINISPIKNKLFLDRLQERKITSYFPSIDDSPVASNNVAQENSVNVNDNKNENIEPLNSLGHENEERDNQDPRLDSQYNTNIEYDEEDEREENKINESNEDVYTNEPILEVNSASKNGINNRTPNYLNNNATKYQINKEQFENKNTQVKQDRYEDNINSFLNENKDVIKKLDNADLRTPLDTPLNKYAQCAQKNFLFEKEIQNLRANGGTLTPPINKINKNLINYKNIDRENVAENNGKNEIKESKSDDDINTNNNTYTSYFKKVCDRLNLTGKIDILSKTNSAINFFNKTFMNKQSLSTEKSDNNKTSQVREKIYNSDDLLYKRNNYNKTGSMLNENSEYNNAQKLYEANNNNKKNINIQPEKIPQNMVNHNDLINLKQVKTEKGLPYMYINADKNAMKTINNNLNMNEYNNNYKNYEQGIKYMKNPNMFMNPQMQTNRPIKNNMGSKFVPKYWINNKAPFKCTNVNKKIITNPEVNNNSRFINHNNLINRQNGIYMNSADMKNGSTTSRPQNCMINMNAINNPNINNMQNKNYYYSKSGPQHMFPHQQNIPNYENAYNLNYNKMHMQNLNGNNISRVPSNLTNEERIKKAYMDQYLMKYNQAINNKLIQNNYIGKTIIKPNMCNEMVDNKKQYMQNYNQNKIDLNRYGYFPLQEKDKAPMVNSHIPFKINKELINLGIKRQVHEKFNAEEELKKGNIFGNAQNNMTKNVPVLDPNKLREFNSDIKNILNYPNLQFNGNLINRSSGHLQQKYGYGNIFEGLKNNALRFVSNSANMNIDINNRKNINKSEDSNNILHKNIDIGEKKKNIYRHANLFDYETPEDKNFIKIHSENADKKSEKNNSFMTTNPDNYECKIFPARNSLLQLKKKKENEGFVNNIEGNTNTSSARFSFFNYNDKKENNNDTKDQFDTDKLKDGASPPKILKGIIIYNKDKKKDSNKKCSVQFNDVCELREYDKDDKVCQLINNNKVCFKDLQKIETQDGYNPIIKNYSINMNDSKKETTLNKDVLTDNLSNGNKSSNGRKTSPFFGNRNSVDLSNEDEAPPKKNNSNEPFKLSVQFEDFVWKHIIFTRDDIIDDKINSFISFYGLKKLFLNPLREKIKYMLQKDLLNWNVNITEML